MLRVATDEDRDRVLAWRNHPEVRRVSLSQDVISPDDHAKWWQGLMADDRRLLLIYERGGVPAGVVTFFDIDRDAGTAYYGYYLDNAGLEERGELLPAWIQIQRDAVKYADHELGLQRLDADVLESNEGVRSFNDRMGFVEVGREELEIGGAAVTVLKIQRTRPS